MIAQRSSVEQDKIFSEKYPELDGGARTIRETVEARTHYTNSLNDRVRYRVFLKSTVSTSSHVTRNPGF